MVRKDLHMRMGKACAQAAHASMAFLTRNLTNEKSGYSKYYITLSSVEEEWIKESYTKICVYVNSEEELRTVMANAFRAGLVCHEIIDSGTTEFNGVPTLTCCAIGPDEAEKIDVITGYLKLL